jgi:anion-transporting  ArsA/GET3 family ATPase
MKCLYCGGQVADLNGQNSCLDCGRIVVKNGESELVEVVESDSSEKRIIKPEENFSLGTDGEQIELLLKKEQEALKKQQEKNQAAVEEKNKKKLAEKTFNEEELARDDIKEKIVNINQKDSKTNIDKNEDNLSYDLSAYKNIDLKNKDMLSEAVHDLSDQTVSNAKRFSNMFKKYTSTFIENLKKDIRED